MRVRFSGATGGLDVVKMLRKSLAGRANPYKNRRVLVMVVG
jgi:hypothetical protein